MVDILSWSRSVLATTPDRWITLSAQLPAELLLRPPASGEWSALECLHHLVDTERWVFPLRVQAILSGQDFDAFDPDSQGTPITSGLDPGALAGEFARLRSQALQVFDRVQPADLTRQARHQELGMVALSQLLHEWAAHDLMHTVQAERAMMQPFIQGSGPWQVYFADHAIIAR